MPFLAADEARVGEAVARMGSGAVVLDRGARAVVESVIREHCELRRWVLHALNVRSNHVHVVVACGVTPEAAMTQFKAWSTRRLRVAGVVGADAKVWTEHGSTRWIDSAKSLEAAVDYVLNHQ